MRTLIASNTSLCYYRHFVTSYDTVFASPAALAPSVTLCCKATTPGEATAAYSG